MGGLLLGASVGRSAPPPDALLAQAVALEGHADNVAAAMYGGITLSVPAEDGSVTLRRFRVPEAWIPVLFIAAPGEPHERDARRAAGGRAARGGRAAGGRAAPCSPRPS